MAQRSRKSSTSDDCRQVDLRLIVDEQHYPGVVERGVFTAATSIWIATANVKDVHVEAPIGSTLRARGRYQSLFAWLKARADSGLDVRLLHAAKASKALGASRAWQLGAAIHRMCPRVHLKMIAVDGRFLYLGSANFTGAGIGAKASGKRNFEAGITTEDPLLLDEMQARFDDIWMGRSCAACKRRSSCPMPIDTLDRVKRHSPSARRAATAKSGK